VLQAVAREIGTSPQAQGAGEPAAARNGARPPTPLPGYQVLEVTIDEGSPAAGRTLGAVAWPPGHVPVSVLHRHALQDPDPGRTLEPGDRVSLLAPAPGQPAPQRAEAGREST
jgi:chloride channel protein, CIC family